MSLFSWFKHKVIFPDVRVLNATIFVDSTPNIMIGKEYYVWRSQMSFFSWFKHKFICPDVRVLNATVFVDSTPNIMIGNEDYVWRLQMSYLADISTSP